MDSYSTLNKKCRLHQTTFTFFCFTDKEFVCNECYKFHRGHKLEIKLDLEDKAKSLGSLKINDQTKILDLFASYRDSLKEIGGEIEREIANANNSIDTFKKNCSISLPENKTLFDLSFEEYDALENLTQKYRNMWTLRKKIENVLLITSSAFNEYYFMPLYNEVKMIQKEVDIIDNSPFRIGYPPTILLNQKSGEHYLSDGNKNHFITFDLKEDYHIKGFKIKLSDFDCSLKNFSVSILREDSFVLVKSYLCPHYDSSVEWNEFELNEIGKVVKFSLIDNWGESGGDYILIKALQFKVGISSLGYNFD